LCPEKKGSPPCRSALEKSYEIEKIFIQSR